MAQVNVLDVIQPVAQIAKNCPIPVLVRAYVDAARKFCTYSRWLRATIDGATIVDEPFYGLGNDPFHEIIGLTAIDITLETERIRALDEQDSSEWDHSLSAGEPRVYQYVPEGQFAVHPSPNKVWSMTIGVVLTPKRGAMSIEESLLTKWEYAFQDGALAYLLDMKEETWANPGKANKSLILFNSAMASAQVQADNNYNPGAKRTNHTGPRAAAVRTRMQPI